MQTAPLVELRSVSKSFGPTRALRDVSLDLRAGEVHALVGENGAGKSTLIRILSGVYGDFDGELRFEGQPLRFRGPTDAARAGIAAIHQELSLVGPMSVADNLLLGRDTGALFGSARRRQRRGEARRILDASGLEVDPDSAVEGLSLALRQLLEVEKALVRRARVVIMDEPTSALSDVEADRLLSRVERLRLGGCAVLYVSHRMDEIRRLADRVTVLRDGARVATSLASEMDPGEIVRQMLGHAPESRYAEPISATGSSVTLAVRDLTVLDPHRPGRRLLDGVSFEAKGGEIVGIAGLRGSGASELLHALFGALGPVVRGSVHVKGAPRAFGQPERSLAHGIVLLANDRRATVLPELSVRENVSLSMLGALSTLGWVSRQREGEVVADAVNRVRLRAPSVESPARHLSGGNQQKVALARCLSTGPRVLLLDEPGRGIDIGAKSDVYDVIRDAAARGAAVLVVASDMEELLLLSHRVIVLCEGRVTANLAGAELNRERVLEAAMSRVRPTTAAERPA